MKTILIGAGKHNVSAIVLLTLATGEQVNDKALEGLATTLKVDVEKLKGQLITKESDVAKMEFKSTELFPEEVVVYKKTEFDLALDRKGKTKYDEGRFAEREMTVKALKKEHGITDDSVKEMPEFLAKYGDKIKAEAGLHPDKQVETLKKEKADLQELAKTKDKEIQTLKDSFNTERQAGAIHAEINTALNNISIDIADDKVAGQRKMLMQALLSEYDFKREDGKTVIYEKGTDKQLKDALQAPISVVDILKEFAPKYVNVKTPTGREDKGGEIPLTGDLAKIKDKAGFTAYLTSQGITDLYSEKAQAVLTQIKAKNPNFKLA